MQRRNFLKCLGSGLLVAAAPAIVKAENIMSVKAVPELVLPIEEQSAKIGKAKYWKMDRENLIAHLDQAVNRASGEEVPCYDGKYEHGIGRTQIQTSYWFQKDPSGTVHRQRMFDDITQSWGPWYYVNTGVTSIPTGKLWTQAV